MKILHYGHELSSFRSGESTAERFFNLLGHKLITLNDEIVDPLSQENKETVVKYVDLLDKFSARVLAHGATPTYDEIKKQTDFIIWWNELCEWAELNNIKIKLDDQEEPPTFRK